MRFLAIGLLVLLVTVAYAEAQAQTSSSFQIKVGSPETVLSTAAMNKNGLMFPDEPIGFVKLPQPNQYLAFGAGGSFSGIRGNAPAGSYVFSGTLFDLTPTYVGTNGPLYSLTTGKIQPSPDGSDFDRDYAGGGPTYLMQLLNNTSGNGTLTSMPPPILLQIYHGEYHYSQQEIQAAHCPTVKPPDPCPKAPAYGGSGLAISTNNGKTLQKIGQILYPQLSRTDYVNICPTPAGGLWSDAAMVRANAKGEYVNETIISSKGWSCDGDLGNIFDYLLFTDRDSTTGANYIGLARARECDVLDALQSNRKPIFYKYYNPNGVPTTLPNSFFTQLGVKLGGAIPVGGASTPVVIPAKGEAINSPNIVYNSLIKAYILSYQYSQQRIALRTSTDLLNWSPEIVVVDVSSEANTRLFNPSIVSADWNGINTDLHFYLYYLQREVNTANQCGGLINPTLQRVLITLSTNQ